MAEAIFACHFLSHPVQLTHLLTYAAAGGISSKAVVNLTLTK
ncbi:MAG: hypothetical protein ACKKL5_02425 [Candidatus Komeilibacteria bacterium]